MQVELTKFFLFMCCIALFSAIGLTYSLAIESSQAIAFFLIGVGACFINFSYYQSVENTI